MEIGNTGTEIPVDSAPTVELPAVELPAGGHSVLQSYHSTFGTPLAAQVAREPLTELCWNARYQVRRPLGSGAQGVVYLAERNGVDGYFTNVALKVFYPSAGLSETEYAAEMRRIAVQAQRVSEIQHDNLVSIRDFVALGGKRVMVLEWVDGLDVARLLRIDRLDRLRARLDRREWERLNDVVVTAGPDHCRLKSGIAVDVIRGCLDGLSALHQRGIVHCDMKPSNIMIKRTGTKKIVDIDSSCVPSEDPPHLRGTPYYMAPEQLAGRPVRLHSDIASLGYVLIELLTGRMIFSECDTIAKLLEAKQRLPSRLARILPVEVRVDPLLWGFINKMIAVEPQNRFPDANAAELDRMGAGSFERNLVKTDLSTEYDRELAWWLSLLGDELAGGR